MNYDGYAIVLNDKSNIVKSINGSTYVNPNLQKIESEYINDSVSVQVGYTTFDASLECNGHNEVIVGIQKQVYYNFYKDGFSNVINTNCIGAITSVYNPNDTTVYEINFTPVKTLSLSSKISITDKFFNKETITVKDDKYNESVCNILMPKTQAVVGIVTKTNMTYTDTSVIKIIDLTQKIVPDKEFATVTATVTDKTEIVIPDVGDMQNLSIIIQKNSFFELELAAIPNNIIGLPDELTWKGSNIKGTLTQSKEYNLTITYNQGEQKINIIVPYYQRLL